MWRARAACAMSIVRFITSKLPSLGTDAPLESSTSLSSVSSSRACVEKRGRAAPHTPQPFGGCAGLFGLLAARLAAGQAHRDGQVCVDSGYRRHGQRIEDAAVGQQPAVENVGHDHPRDRNRRPDRRVDGPALQPHRLPRQQVGADGRVRDRQLFDRDLTEDVADGVEDLLGPQHPGSSDLRIE